jgi:hypothetical protein
MLSAYSGASSSEGNSPVQPVAYRHTMHVDTLKMNCLYCHFSANKSFDPGLPAVGTCMGCHTVVSGSSPANKAEIQKLAGFWNKKQPVPWIRIHKLPEYVHFPHMRHVNAGVTCQIRLQHMPLLSVMTPSPSDVAVARPGSPQVAAHE